MNKFNLQEALKGATVILRNGRTAEIKFITPSKEVPDGILVGIVHGESTPFDDKITEWLPNGRIFANDESDFDIVGIDNLQASILQDLINGIRLFFENMYYRFKNSISNFLFNQTRKNLSIEEDLFCFKVAIGMPVEKAYSSIFNTDKSTQAGIKKIAKEMSERKHIKRHISFLKKHRKYYK